MPLSVLIGWQQKRASLRSPFEPLTGRLGLPFNENWHFTKTTEGQLRKRIEKLHQTQLCQDALAGNQFSRDTDHKTQHS